MKNLKTIGIVVGVIIAGAVVALASGAYNPSWNPFGASKSNEDLVIVGFEKTFDAKSLQVDGSLEIIAKGVKGETGFLDFGDEPKDITLTIDFSNKIDQQDQQNVKTDTDITLGLNTEGVDLSAVLKLQTQKDNFYFMIASLPAFLPLGDSLEALQGSWVKITYPELQNFLAASGVELPSMGQGEMTGLIQGLNDLVRGKRLFVAKRKLAQEKIGETTAQRYVVGFDKDGFKAIIPDYINFVKSLAPQEQIAEFASQIDKMQEDFLANFEENWAVLKDFTFDIWTEKGTGKLVKMQWQKEIQPPQESGLSESVKTLSFNFVLTFSNFGAKFETTEPTEYKTLTDVAQLFALPAEPATTSDSTLP